MRDEDEAEGLQHPRLPGRRLPSREVPLPSRTPHAEAHAGMRKRVGAVIATKGKYTRYDIS